MSALRGPRAVLRLTRAVLHGAHGLLVVWLRLPGQDDTFRQRQVQWWSAKMLRLLGVALQVDGHFGPGARLIVANHVSWLDILVVHAVCPQARFVSKADVRQWPMINRLVDAGGTLYLERGRKRDAMRVVHQMAAALAAGDMVAVFPEGTTGDGHVLLPFHANLLQAAIATATPVQPLALRYADARHAVSAAAQWLGDTTLAGSLWRLATADGLRVRLQVLAEVTSAQAERRQLSDQLRALIAERLDA